MNQFISHFVHDQLVCIMTVFGVQTIIIPVHVKYKRGKTNCDVENKCCLTSIPYIKFLILLLG